ncbi:MAG: diguanylate cyclase, partial [Syntrophotalea sp.]
MVKFTHDWELWLDPNGALLYSSPSCERITGFRDEDFRRDPDLLSQIIAVMMLDLDDFKQINDTTGHAKGDELLVMLTARMRQQLHPGDMLARLGGDESILLL